MKVLVPLATGFEEIEAITIIDVLRRADIDVTSAAILDNPVIGSHNIEIGADKQFDSIDISEFDMLVLPGGMPGSKHLKEDSRIQQALTQFQKDDKYLAALCAAPIALGKAGVLHNKKATCFPGFENELTGAHVSTEPVVADGKIITGRGPGCAIPFTLKLVEIIKGKELSDKIKTAMQVYWM